MADEDGATTLNTDELERWADIRDDPDAIVACGERWKAVAEVIGCTLHGFNDGRAASFFTPDGNVIEIGPKFRATLAALATLEAERVKSDARVERTRDIVLRELKRGRQAGESQEMIARWITTALAEQEPTL